MKKTLIALAAVAATGVAFAQSSVTLSGKFGVGFGKAIAGDSGLVVTDGDIRFTATEDLGSGLRATAAMELRVRGRGSVDAGPAACTALPCPAANSGVGGRNATVSLAGGFGSVTLGAVEAGNGIIARGFAGAPVALQTAYDGAILSGPANVDWFMYTSPQLIPGLTANYQRVDSITAPGAGKGALQANVVGVNYAAGPISAGLDYTQFSNDRKRVRLSASYDLGVARVGFGMEDNRSIAGSDGRQYALGVSAPLGPVTVGAVYARNGEAFTGGGQSRGWAIGADYNLSKRTAVNFTYGDRQRVNGANDANGDQYRIRLMHSF
ncbi:MAG TPA: porin [Hydrogenophaga sp.]|uniref:porin n=1 Tax=Hydrogenophaga sp. TaxID=1904254 RepID=UPI002C31E1A1|nr:porin [Hydrogenophaga sp.]HMN92522.1 porin [Hydrogenophaga sp.]HMP10440.1 porin [Hydrogenophaga sp.]